VKRTAKIAMTAPLLSGLILSAATSAQSAEDTTPPVLKAPVKSSFTVGTQVPAGYVPDCGNGEAHDLRVWVGQNFKWRGSDDSGYVRYDLVENTGRGGDVNVFSNSSQTSYGETYLGTNTNQDCGGGNGSIYEWNLTARDAAGNSTTRDIYGGRIKLTQDNNLADLANYATTPQIDYTGSWQRASCRCWSNGGIHKTSAPGAAASIKVPLPYSPWGGSATEPQDAYSHVGLVMHKGPDRGKFTVYVNGVLKGTVDTYAPTNQPRMVVWQTAVDGRASGTATIEIVNEATPGRNRIDLDAVLTN